MELEIRKLFIENVITKTRVVGFTYYYYYYYATQILKFNESNVFSVNTLRRDFST